MKRGRFNRKAEKKKKKRVKQIKPWLTIEYFMQRRAQTREEIV